MRRRRFIAAAGALLGAPLAAAQTRPATGGTTRAVEYPAVVPGRMLEFPRDHGAHPAFRTEWWYATGSLSSPAGRAFGFQVTFFRARPEHATPNPSAFAFRQALFAHAAVADPGAGRLLHDQRAARAVLGLAGAAEGRTEAWVDDWRLAQTARGYRTRIPAREFTLELDLEETAPLLLQGEAGFSRKGPRPHEASYYYSRPQLRARGSLTRTAGRETVEGVAWLDHEWSSAYLAPEAAGWDWIGINLDDGGALMAFRMRAKAGGVYYAGATLRTAQGRETRYGPREVAFEPLRVWRSPRTAVAYPVAMRVRAGDNEWLIEPLMDDQELDARASTATIYWEGAVRALRDARPAGRGYLELTGYWRPLVL